MFRPELFSTGIGMHVGHFSAIKKWKWKLNKATRRDTNALAKAVSLDGWLEK